MPSQNNTQPTSSRFIKGSPIHDDEQGLRDEERSQNYSNKGSHEFMYPASEYSTSKETVIVGYQPEFDCSLKFAGKKSNKSEARSRQSNQRGPQGQYQNKPLDQGEEPSRMKGYNYDLDEEGYPETRSEYRYKETAGDKKYKQTEELSSKSSKQKYDPKKEYPPLTSSTIYHDKKAHNEPDHFMKSPYANVYDSSDAYQYPANMHTSDAPMNKNLGYYHPPGSKPPHMEPGNGKGQMGPKSDQYGASKYNPANPKKDGNVNPYMADPHHDYYQSYNYGSIPYQNPVQGMPPRHKYPGQGLRGNDREILGNRFLTNRFDHSHGEAKDQRPAPDVYEQR
jgi:hypothetical protein